MVTSLGPSRHESKDVEEERSDTTDIHVSPEIQKERDNSIHTTINSYRAWIVCQVWLISVLC